MTSRRSNFAAAAAAATFLLATVIMVPQQGADAFLSGAPGPRTKLSPPSKPEGGTQLDDVESRPVAVDERAESR